MAKIQNREATIRTMSVEIKALTVSGRQVTQALFKQLEAAPLIDEASLTFNGIPWGRVNYHVGCTEYSGEHLHIVWQEGDELRRSYIERDRIRAIVNERVGFGEPWFWSALLKALFDGEPTLDGVPVTQADEAEGGYEYKGRLSCGGMQIEQARDALIRHLIEYWQGGDPGYLPDDRVYTQQYISEQKERSLRRARDWIISDLQEKGARADWETRSAAENLAMYESIRAQRARLAEDWEKLWTSLRDLEQLFIAV